jgi:transcriptional antiterminator RfaH
MTTTTANDLSWYVVHTRPKQEDRTAGNLLTLDLEVLSPKLRVTKYNEFNGNPTRLIKPLFPGYIFASFNYTESYHRVRFTRGVHSVICFNDEPTPVDDEIIELIRSRVDRHGFVKNLDELKAGDEVRIRDGRFQNLCGVFEREMPDSDRVSVLLNAVSFQAHVVVDRALLSKVTHEEHAVMKHRVAYSC